MVLLRKQLQLNLVAAAAALGALAAPAWAVGPPTWSFPSGRTMPVADSTTNHVISVGVPIPFCDAACMLQNLPPPSQPGATGIPPGYKEVTSPAGPHFLGQAGYLDGGYSLSYDVTPSNYMNPDPYAAAAACTSAACQTSVCGQAGLPGRYINYPAQPVSFDPYGNLVPSIPAYTQVCEPIGTRTTLQKVVTSVQASFTQPYLNSKYLVAVPAGHMTWGLDAASTITPICQAEGYTNYVPGTITTTYKGSGCNDYENISFYLGGWVNATYACYHYILTGLSCYK